MESNEYFYSFRKIMFMLNIKPSSAWTCFQIDYVYKKYAVATTFIRDNDFKLGPK